MKYIVWLLSSVNVYFGFTCFLNVIHVLQDSKYSEGATAMFAAVFLVMGISGFYFSVKKTEYIRALYISIGPWLIALLILFITMMTSDYK